MTRDSHLFDVNLDSQQDYLPLYEAKLMHQFDHRYASRDASDFTEVSTQNKLNPDYSITPRSFVTRAEVEKRLLSRRYSAAWMCGFRSVSSPTNERTSIAAIFPFSAVGNSINLILGLRAADALLFTANANSFCFDFACRQKMSGMNLNIWIMKQLPAVPLRAYEHFGERVCGQLKNWLSCRALELVYTGWDLKSFAEDLNYPGPPFRWDEDRRFLLRCELDAAFFHLYGISHNDADYIMDAFPIVKRKDEGRYGEFRTKRVILEIYDAISAAIRAGQPYATRLDPPPGPPERGLPPWLSGNPLPTTWPPHIHPPKKVEIQA